MVSLPLKRFDLRVAVVFGIALVLAALTLVLPFGTAYADRAYCPQCGRVTTGTIYYDAYDGYYPPTCTRAGTGLFYCDECLMYNGTQIPALGHSYAVSTSKEATCEEDGEELHRCRRCGYSYTEPLEALGHEMVMTEDVAPTCTAAGHTVLSCSRCGKEEITDREAFGHFFVTSGYLKPSCLEAGDEVRACMRCGEEEHTAIPALGHAWGSWATRQKPSSFHDGLEARSCTRCGLEEERLMARLPLTGTPAGIGLLAGGAAVLLLGLGFAVKKSLAARAAAKLASAAGKGFELLKFTEKKILAKLGPEASNAAFVNAAKAKPNLSITLFDVMGEADFSAKMEEVDPDAVILDCHGAAGLEEAVALIGELRAEHENVVFEIIAFDADGAVRARLEELKEQGVVARYAFAEENRFVKMSKLVVPLYKDLMTDADSVESIGFIAEIFGIPAVTEFLEVLATVEHGGEIVEVAKDKFSGVDMEVSDGLTVVNAIAEILGIDGIAAASELLEDLGDTKESVTSDEEGKIHAGYKAGEVAKDVGDVIGSILG